MGAIVVVFLAGLAFPIVLLALAVLFDIFVVMWTAYCVGRDEGLPRLRHSWTSVMGVLHVPRHLPIAHRSH
jgi:hypothetical protein